MSEIAVVAALAAALLIGLPVVLLCVRDWVTSPSPQQIQDALARFDERLRHPDLAAGETHFGHPLPECVRALYANLPEMLRGAFETAEAPNAGPDDRWYVNSYQPAVAQSVQDAWPGTEKYFAFATDGCGNDYLIDPTEEDPAVLFHYHETRDLEHVCDHFTEFMKWPRMESEA